MKKKITDINDLVLFLTSMALKPLLIDEIWQNFGYRKRPKKGRIWSRLFPKKFKLENLIMKDLLTMGLIDTLNGIKKSSKLIDTQLVISIGVIDKFLSTIKYLFDPIPFMDNLFSIYSSFAICENLKSHEPFILKSKNILNKKHFAKFLVGIITLLGMSTYTDGFLIKNDYIKEIIDDSFCKNKLQIDMSDKMCEKYVNLVLEKILNS